MAVKFMIDYKTPLDASWLMPKITQSAKLKLAAKGVHTLGDLRKYKNRKTLNADLGLTLLELGAVEQLWDIAQGPMQSDNEKLLDKIGDLMGKKGEDDSSPEEKP
jgi:hypothetical protein